MRIFKISKEIEVKCNSKSTSSGFRHLATLLRNGIEVADAKCTYQNRTWERYEFQSVLSEVVEKASLSEAENKLCRDFIEGDQTDWSGFKATAMVAKIGDILCDNQKDKNDWKARMLKAGLGNQGLVMPDDWDSLDEDTKQARLDSIIKMAGDAGKKNGNDR
ncbi:hypothetical protein CMI37_22340 [Candidatus Pacearchaeota archaeon]|nr:hypothetical protein [Candidatus Pacearchaeota archaeon]|tara:strand:+ start:3109 stop:3594 length:486 start_codon:yes stop_codon:yes gene_type:complete